MQRRNSVKPSGLDRRKSTSSVKSVQLLHITTEKAERDAQVAANQAFQRARERSATESDLWPPSRQSNRPSPDRHYSSPDRRSNESIVYKQQQSVRFVKPRSSAGLAQPRRQHDKTPSRTSGATKTRNSENNVPGVWPTANRAPASGVASAAKSTASDYINALIAGDEYYTPEDNIASLPSSYRRIRKSRSLFSSFDDTLSGENEPGNRLSENFSPSNLDSASYQPVEDIPLTRLKAPKSMSFLKNRREPARPLSTLRESMPLATRATNAIPPGSARTQSSSSQFTQFLGSRPHKSGKALRRTLRDTSDTTESGSLNLGGTSSKDKGISKKARKVSHNFKIRIKSFFNLARSENDKTGFPPQQIEAQKTHVVEVETEDASLSRVTSGIPSLHAVPSEQQLRSRQVSLESLGSERKVSDEKSRVTSWTNSDAHTSTATSSQGREWERQRLSVIKEHGAHISSSASRRPDLASQWTDSSSIINLPQEKPLVNQSSNIDSQRIYSALMKRLNEARQASLALEKERKRMIEDSSAEETASTRNISIAPTIRQVVSDDDIAQKMTEVGPAPEPTEDPRPSSRSSTTQDCDTTFQKHQSENSAGHLEETPRVRTLSARKSAFFGSPTCHLFRTQSPYRRALQSSISSATDQVSSPVSSEFNPFMQSLNNLPIRSVSRCESDTDGKLHYSESIYSNEGPHAHTDSDTLPLVDSFPSPPSNHGAVTIFIDPPRPSPPVKSHRRLASSASSVEWKTWLSANVSKLEDSALAGDLQSGGESDLSLARFQSASGHLREKAQISECEDEEGTTEPLTQDRPENALGNLESNTLNTGHRSRPASTNKDALLDKENQAPPVPLKSALRLRSSATSLRSSAEKSQMSTSGLKEKAHDTEAAKPPTHVRSSNTLGSRPQSRTPSPVKLVRRQQRPANQAAHGHKSSIGEAVEKQFGKVIESPSPNRIPTDQEPRGSENVHPGRALENERSEDGQGDESLGPDEKSDAQGMGSKQMVDLFLSSRRRRIAGSEECYEPAFV